MIVNIGDMLQEMTNGEYKATTHRVIVPEGEDASGSRGEISGERESERARKKERDVRSASLCHTLFHHQS